jgi:hypothetical protein
MVPAHYVWFAWSATFFLSWLVLYGGFSHYRKIMRWSSWVAAPFGLTEFLFAGHYWNPPSLFDSTRIAHVDVESVVFCFAIGGVAAVLYDMLGGPSPAIRPKTSRHSQEVYKFILAMPALVFAPVLFGSNQPMLAGIAALFAGVAARWIAHPELCRKTVIGGLLFTAYYGVFLAILGWISPGYLHRVWTSAAGPVLWGVPIDEPLFAVAFGMFWSGLYEQFHWTMMSGPNRRRSDHGIVRVAK